MKNEYEKIGKRYAKSLEESMQKTMEETSLFELKQLLMPFIAFNKEKKEWVGLTDDEKQEAYLKIDAWNNCVNWIETTLREKNNG